MDITLSNFMKNIQLNYGVNIMVKHHQCILNGVVCFEEMFEFLSCDCVLSQVLFVQPVYVVIVV